MKLQILIVEKWQSFKEFKEKTDEGRKIGTLFAIHKSSW